MRRAVAVAEVAAGLRTAGFGPHLIVGHESWGETLNLADIWPGVPQIGFREYYYHGAGADVGYDPEFPLHPAFAAGLRAKNAAGLLALMQGHRGVCPTAWQRSLYPGWAQARIALVPDGVEAAASRPARTDAPPFHLGPFQVAPHERLVTFAARDLEPYRGFHVFARALPDVMRRPDVRVICLGGDGVSYGVPPPTGTWRGRLMAELAGRIDPARLHCPGRVAHAEYVAVLRRSDLHAYLSYPFIASWSLRDALSHGCAVVAADTAPAREFITDGENGVLVPGLDPAIVAAAILDLLADPARCTALGQAAQARAAKTMRLDHHLEGWRTVIAAATGGH